MIGWWVAAAHAEPFHVDLLAVPVTAHTEGIRASSDSLDVDGRTISAGLDPATVGWQHRGGQLEIGACGRSGGPEWLVALGYRQDNPGYALARWEFHPSAHEIKVQGGFLGFASREPRAVDLYVGAYTGLQLSVLDSHPFDPLMISPGWASSLSLGLATRNTPVRIRVEGRVDLVPRVDQFSGSAQLVENAFGWRYNPGVAAASLVLGVGYASHGPR